MLCNGDVAFFYNCPATLEGLRLWAHERTFGIPRSVEDLGTGGHGRPYTFNREVGVDVFEIVESVGITTYGQA